jgi:methylmalonyl-CoA carboxyltransferase 12S subunit
MATDAIVTPEVLAVIAASVTAFLGKKVRIRSARVLETPYAVERWARQGRLIVQTSHNLGRLRR